jgi:glycosyltransferase involved in cell wall biosynthesis
LKVVFVSWRDRTHPNAGGSEVVVDRLIERLIERGHTAALVCGGPVGDIEYPVVSSGGTYSQYVRAPFIARRFRDYDLLVDVSNGVPYMSPLWWRGARLCFFHHVHGDQWHGQFHRAIAETGWFIERKVIPLVYRNTVFAAVSPSTTDALHRLGVARSSIHLVHNGIDEELLAEPVPTSEEPLFLMLGRIAANKQVKHVLDAWERVRHATGGRLVIAGDGPLRPELEARNVSGVEFRGRVSEEEKRLLLGSATLMVHAARHEGWGIAIMEAAAQATPTLAFDVDGVRDSVVHGKTGILVSTQSEFEGAWISLARDSRRTATLGAAARSRAMEFTWDRSADELLAAADAAVGRH